MPKTKKSNPVTQPAKAEKSKGSTPAKNGDKKNAPAFLKLDKDGGITKSKRPVSKATKELNVRARMAIASGDLSKDELKRRTERDLRTLYVKFKESKPSSEAEIRAIHPNIQQVRTPRQAMKKQSQHIQYCFIEFSDEQKTVEAKAKLSSDPKLYIDFVGVKSKNGAEKLSKRKIKPPINPTRLHVSGLMKGMDEDKLRKLFPKCSSAVIPKASARKGSNFAFVQFLSPADAKAAFDAAQKLKVETEKGANHITVVYATVSKHGPPKDPAKEEAKKQNKAQKRKQGKNLETKVKKAKAVEEVTELKEGDGSSDEVAEEQGEESEESEESDKENAGDSEESSEQEEVQNDESEEEEEEEESGDDDIENDAESSEEEDE